MSKLVKKWWFWLIVVLVAAILFCSPRPKEESNNSPYISKYEWNMNNTQTYEADFDLDKETLHYVLLEIENKEGDLQAGEYKVRTDGSNNSTFLINVTDKKYDDLNELPLDIMVQDNSPETIKVDKGQYVYIVKGTTGTDNGKVFLEKQ